MALAAKISKELWLLIVGLPLVLGAAYLVLTHPFFSIPSQSGVPNVLKDDLILPRGSKIVCGQIQPERGDLVIFRHKTYTYLKRLVGFPGDRIQFKNGVLVINDAAVQQQPAGRTTLDLGGFRTKADLLRETLPNSRSYLVALVDRTAAQENNPLFTLPAGQYFVVGDNRDNSLDSRFDEDNEGIGLVPAGNLCAVAERVLSSSDRSHIWKAL